MAMQCKGCGHFIQDGTPKCPVCGGGFAVGSKNTQKHNRVAAKGLIKESWNNFRENGAELMALSSIEARLFKVAIGVMIAIFIPILFVSR